MNAPPIALAFALAITCLWAIDAIWSTATFDAQLCVYGLCLALAGGALIGALASAASMLIQWLPRVLRLLLWPVLTVAAALGLAFRLGAFVRVHGHYSVAAWTVIGGGVAVALALGLLLSWVHAIAHRPDPRRLPWSRHALAVLLLATTAALFYVDRVMYVGLYPDAHSALRAGAITTLALVLMLWRRPLRLRSLGALEITLLALIGTVPLWATAHADASAFYAFGQRPWSLALLRSARVAVDFDRDGASRLLAGGDCDDWNAKVHPLAREIADNGIDDNCIFGDARRHADISENVAVPTTASPLNVVLITIDTLTYNRLGVYDSRYGALGRNTAPNLEAWAKRATVFSQAYATGSWTSISLASLMRGVYPRKLHWSRYNETSAFRLFPSTAGDKGLLPGESITKIFPLAWKDPHRPLASWLKRRGMRTHAIVDDGFSSMLFPDLGCNDGFDRYELVEQSSTPKHDDATAVDLTLSALRSARRSGDRFFLWTHFFGPHTPNDSHRRVRVYGDTQSDLYDHEVRNLDDELGRLLRALHKYRRSTAIFITADHGEVFGKGYRSHGFDLSEGMIRVPLLARVPGWPARRVETPVSLVDLMPTILDITDTPAPTWLDGTSLTPLAHDPRRPSSRVMYADTWQYGRAGEAHLDLVAAFDGTHKVVLNRLDQTADTFLQRGKPDTQPATQVPDEQRLTTRLRAYLEETGGALRLSP